MLISAKALEAHGFIVEIDSKRGNISIYPQNPLRLDWTPMEEQFDSLDLSGYDRETALDEFHRAVETAQIMRVVKQTQ